MRWVQPSRTIENSIQLTSFRLSADEYSSVRGLCDKLKATLSSHISGGLRFSISQMFYSGMLISILSTFQFFLSVSKSLEKLRESASKGVVEQGLVGRYDPTRNASAGRVDMGSTLNVISGISVLINIPHCSIVDQERSRSLRKSTSVVLIQAPDRWHRRHHNAQAQ